MIVNRKHSHTDQNLKGHTSEFRLTVTGDKEPSDTPAEEMGIMRVAFLVVFIVRSAQQNSPRTLLYYPTKAQKTETDIIIL